MSIALIDHSTLSSVQRVLGQIEVKDKSSIDGDLSAFEQFIYTLLFYNDWIALDDYKIEYSENRKKEFSFIDFIDPNDFNGNEISQKSLEMANQFYPRIEGGEFADEAFREFFQLLDINIRCTWDISNSLYYLTLKMLGDAGGYEFKKYGEICHLIFSELTELRNSGYRRDTSCTYMDRYGTQIDPTNYKIPNAKHGNGETNGISSGLYGFIAAMNWISFKSIYYTSFAEYLKADSLIHPIRQNFQMYYLGKTKQFGHNYIEGILHHFDKRVSEEINAVNAQQNSNIISVSIPNFLTYIVAKTNDPSEIIPYALKLRDSQEFVHAREQLGVIQNFFDQGNNLLANKEKEKISQSLNSAFNEIRRTYYVPVNTGDNTSKLITNINKAGSVFGLPNISQIVDQSKVPNIVSRLINRKSFSVIYRNLSKELLKIQSLGKYYDLLTQKVCVNDQLVTYNPKAESPDYKDFHSSWKSPM